jgi:hypothetical protein
MRRSRPGAELSFWLLNTMHNANRYGLGHKAQGDLKELYALSRRGRPNRCIALNTSPVGQARRKPVMGRRSHAEDGEEVLH